MVSKGFHLKSDFVFNPSPVWPFDEKGIKCHFFACQEKLKISQQAFMTVSY